MVDKGKGKMVEPKKPSKAAHFPLQIGGAFKIYERKTSTFPKSPTMPRVKKSLVSVKKPVVVPSRVARALKLVYEEEESEAGQPIKAASKSAPQSWLLLSRMSR
jgi:hypothetical protein